MSVQLVAAALGHRSDDEFVGTGDPLQCLQPLHDFVRVADELCCDPVCYDSQLLLGQRRAGVAGAAAMIAPGTLLFDEKRRHKAMVRADGASQWTPRA